MAGSGHQPTNERVLIDHPSGPRWRFIEAKSFFWQRPGGVPIGN
jgi:hypothetical protein